MNCPVSPFALAVKPVLLTALTISPAVAKLLALPVVLAIPPVLVIGAVTAAIWLLPLMVVVVPSVFAATV